jgi:hypothetical protein
MVSGAWTLGALVAEAGLTCAACGTADCVRPHGRRCRKRVRDLSTGEVFEGLPILRVRCCSGTTLSLMPAELWRGRFTLTSVVETVVHVLRDGVEAAHEWTGFAGTGETVVSRRTLRRWRELARTRLIGSALSWLGPRLGLHGSDSTPPADHLEALLDRLTGTVLLAFRAALGRAALDRHSDTCVAAAARSAARRIAGRQALVPPHDPPPARRPRGAWLPPNRRGPPRPAHGKEDRRS